MTRTAASVTMALTIAAINGGLVALYPNPPRNLNLLLTLGPQIVALAVLFWWLNADSVKHGLRRSMLLNIGIVALTVVFLPVYLYRSRPQGKRLAAIVKSFGLLLLYILVGAVALLIVGAVLQ